jgi:hypothetical protein
MYLRVKLDILLFRDLLATVPLLLIQY